MLFADTLIVIFIPIIKNTMKYQVIKGRMLKYIICFFILFSVTYSFAEAASRIVVMGSSTAAGYLLSANQSWVSQYATHLSKLDSHNQVINLAKSGYTTYHVMPDEFTAPSGKPAPDKNHNITLALSYKPDVIIINLPTNDIAKDYSIDEILDNYARFVEIASLHGVQVWITTTQPRKFSTTTLQNRLLELNDRLYEIYGDRVIDFWSGLATETGEIKSIYKNDNAHLNKLGHTVLFNRVLDANIHQICDKGSRRFYLIGGATDALWSGAKSIPFTQDDDNPNIYTLVCELRHKTVDNGTQFRILNQPSTTGTGLFAKKKDELLTDNSTVYVQKTSSLSNTNYRWTVPSAKQGYYKLTINVSDNTLTPQYLGDMIYKPEELYLTGGTTEGGWNVENAIPFIQDADNPDVFKLVCLLKNSSDSEGNKFKIIGRQGTKKFGLHPKDKDQVLGTSCSVNQKEAPASLDYKWTVSSTKQGYYILTVDVASKTLTAKYCGRTLVLPTTLYLVGGATEAGWNGLNGIPFGQDLENPNLFTLTCLLKHNKSVANGDQFRIVEQPTIASGKGLFPKKNKQSIASVSTYVENTTSVSGSHYRWLVPSAKQGYYTLIVDILAKTLTAKYLGTEPVLQMLTYTKSDFFDESQVASSIESVQANVSIVSYNDGVKVITNDYNNYTTKTVEIINIEGRTIISRQFKENETTVSGITKGIYIVSVTYLGEKYSEKLIVR